MSAQSFSIFYLNSRTSSESSDKDELCLYAWVEVIRSVFPWSPSINVALISFVDGAVIGLEGGMAPLFFFFKYYLYIRIKPKLLKLSQISTSAQY